MRVYEVLPKTARNVLEHIELNVLEEMANLISNYTGLPHNIVIWTRPQPERLPHNKYRLKVYKNRAHVATYTIGSVPKIVFSVKKRKYYELDSDERKEIQQFIEKNYPILISFIDEKISEQQLIEYLSKTK